MTDIKDGGVMVNAQGSRSDIVRQCVKDHVAHMRLSTENMSDSEIKAVAKRAVAQQLVKQSAANLLKQVDALTKQPLVQRAADKRGNMGPEHVVFTENIELSRLVLYDRPVFYARFTDGGEAEGDEDDVDEETLLRKFQQTFGLHDEEPQKEEKEKEKKTRRRLVSVVDLHLDLVRQIVEANGGSFTKAAGWFTKHGMMLKQSLSDQYKEAVYAHCKPGGGGADEEEEKKKGKKTKGKSKAKKRVVGEKEQGMREVLRSLLKYVHEMRLNTESGTDGQAIYPVFSFVNHSCNPNAVHFFDNRGRVLVYTTRPVRAGEPLTVSYSEDLLCRPDGFQLGQLDPHNPNALSRSFRCACEVCNTPNGTASAISLWHGLPEADPVRDLFDKFHRDFYHAYYIARDYAETAVMIVGLLEQLETIATQRKKLEAQLRNYGVLQFLHNAMPDASQEEKDSVVVGNIIPQKWFGTREVEVQVLKELLDERSLKVKADAAAFERHDKATAECMKRTNECYAPTLARCVINLGREQLLKQVPADKLMRRQRECQACGQSSGPSGTTLVDGKRLCIACALKAKPPPQKENTPPTAEKRDKTTTTTRDQLLQQLQLHGLFPIDCKQQDTLVQLVFESSHQATQAAQLCGAVPFTSSRPTGRAWLLKEISGAETEYGRQLENDAKNSPDEATRIDAAAELKECRRYKFYRLSFDHTYLETAVTEASKVQPAKEKEEEEEEAEKKKNSSTKKNEEKESKRPAPSKVEMVPWLLQPLGWLLRQRDDLSTLKPGARNARGAMLVATAIAHLFGVMVNADFDPDFLLRSGYFVARQITEPLNEVSGRYMRWEPFAVEWGLIPFYGRLGPASPVVLNLIDFAAGIHCLVPQATRWLQPPQADAPEQQQLPLPLPEPPRSDVEEATSTAPESLIAKMRKSKSDC